MKKILLLLLAIVLLFPCICSCKTSSNAEPYTVYEIASEDYISNANHSSEVKLDYGYSEKFKLIKSKTVTVGNTKCDVKYTETETGYWYNNDIDYYIGTDNEGHDVKIGINTKTGDIDRYFLISEESEAFFDLTEKGRDECLEIAKEYLSNYVDDVENYKITFEKFNKGKEIPSKYFFVFSRYVEELETFDRARIGVNIYGVICEHRFDCLGELKDAKVPNQATLDELDVKVTEKLDEIYSTVKDICTVEYDEINAVFVRLSNGKYAIEYEVTVKLTPFDTNTKMPYETPKFIVYLD